jgi:hypothetical protein
MFYFLINQSRYAVTAISQKVMLAVDYLTGGVVWGFTFLSMIKMF